MKDTKTLRRRSANVMGEDVSLIQSPMRRRSLRMGACSETKVSTLRFYGRWGKR
jgi:hypothetical protein